MWHQRNAGIGKGLAQLKASWVQMCFNLIPENINGETRMNETRKGILYFCASNWESPLKEKHNQLMECSNVGEGAQS